MKVLFVSLGCDKNLVDSEYMIGSLAKNGYQITDVDEEADIAVINTCCFIHDAKEESINTIIETAALKETANLKWIVVCGCLAQRYQDEILKEIPEVDIILGTNSVKDIVEAVKGYENQISSGKLIRDINEPLDIKDENRFVSTGGHYAYLKIAEGCNKRCTYCVIPSIRGNYRSVPLEELVAEAKKLCAGGVKELILVAQETTVYGTDLYGEKSLYRLLDELQKIDDLMWIRLMYCYPEEIDEKLIDAMVRNDKVLHYLDMPMQHISDDVLKAMGRKTRGSELADKIELLREKMPDICIRTSLICGFPGETEENHVELMEFLNWAELDRVGAFTYSREENTPAYSMDNQVEEAVKEAYRNDVMELQQEISYDINNRLVGTTTKCFVEGRLTDSDSDTDVYVGRTYRDAPGVDGYIYIYTDEVLSSGDFIDVKITGAKDYDLTGEPV